MLILVPVSSEMMDRSNSQYDSFLFWRQPIPELDLSELEDLGLIDGSRVRRDGGRRQEEEEVSEEDDIIS